MGLTDLIAKFSGSGKTVLEQNLRSRFQSIYDYLRGLPEIRIFTANSQNFGHQASTVNILRNLIRMGVPGPYTLVLYGRTMTDRTDLVRKIALLIPQFTAGATTFTLNGCTVNVKEMDPSTPVLTPAAFAINGGFDDKEPTKEVPWAQLNVLNYLQLQPYAWERGTNMVRIKDGPLPDVINLDELSPGTNLQRRAFYLAPAITADDWTKMKAGAYAVQSKICE